MSDRHSDYDAYGIDQIAAMDMDMIDGMDLRDWFAGQALSAIRNPICSEQDYAEWAYKVADAMMEARK